MCNVPVLFWYRGIANIGCFSTHSLTAGVPKLYGLEAPFTFPPKFKGPPTHWHSHVVGRALDRPDSSTFLSLTRSSTSPGPARLQEVGWPFSPEHAGRRTTVMEVSTTVASVVLVLLPALSLLSPTSFKGTSEETSGETPPQHQPSSQWPLQVLLS